MTAGVEDLPRRVTAFVTCIAWATGIGVLVLAPAGAGRVAVAQEPNDKRLALGTELFRVKGCVACHGSTGLPLHRISTYSDADILDVFASPPAGMPVFELTIEERGDLLAYLRATYGSARPDGEK